MSYVKSTDFAVKDTLPSGAPDKIVRGGEVDVEFNAIQADSALKATLASPTFTGTVTLPSGQTVVNANLTGVPTVPTPGTNIDTTQAVNGEWVNDYYAPLISPALTGVPTVPTAAPGTSSTQAASTAFVQTAAFTAALPAQTGNSGKFVTTNGTTASWSDLKTINGVSVAGAGNITHSELGLIVTHITGTTGTVTAGQIAYLDNAAATTMTLGAISDGGEFAIVCSNGRTDNTLDIGAKTLYGANGQTLTGVITFDTQIRLWTFKYTAATTSLEIK